MQPVIVRQEDAETTVLATPEVMIISRVGEFDIVKTETGQGFTNFSGFVTHRKQAQLYPGSMDTKEMLDLIQSAFLDHDGKFVKEAEFSKTQAIKDNIILVDNKLLSQQVIGRMVANPKESMSLSSNFQSLQFRDQQNNGVAWRWNAEGDISLKINGREMFNDDFKKAARSDLEINQSLKIFPHTNNDAIRGYDKIFRCFFDCRTFEVRPQIEIEALMDILKEMGALPQHLNGYKKAESEQPVQYNVAAAMAAAQPPASRMNFGDVNNASVEQKQEEANLQNGERLSKNKVNMIAFIDCIRGSRSTVPDMSTLSALVSEPFRKAMRGKGFEPNEIQDLSNYFLKNKDKMESLKDMVHAKNRENLQNILDIFVNGGQSR